MLRCLYKIMITSQKANKIIYNNQFKINKMLNGIIGRKKNLAGRIQKNK